MQRASDAQHSNNNRLSIQKTVCKHLIVVQLEKCIVLFIMLKKYDQAQKFWQLKRKSLNTKLLIA